jgi:hypothetical protein
MLERHFRYPYKTTEWFMGVSQRRCINHRRTIVTVENHEEHLLFPRGIGGNLI